jgi:hypothetical protein
MRQDVFSTRRIWQVWLAFAFCAVFLAGVHFGRGQWGYFAAWSGIAAAWLGLAYGYRRRQSRRP